MGHRTVKRVPLDFNWPLKQTWTGFLSPSLPSCPQCDGDGQHPLSRPIADSFYAFNGDPASAWKDKITQDEVDHLLAKGRLSTWVQDASERGGRWEQLPRTAADVNAEQHGGGFSGHDGINRGILIKYRCAKLGLPYLCDVCEGHGYVGTPEEHALLDAWEPTEPPAGAGWQLWETTTEGSPVSPVFSDAVDLAKWCEDNATWFGGMKWTAEQWLRSFMDETTDVDSLLVVRRS